MPLYKFKCSTCNHEFETIVKFSEVEAVLCPEPNCGGKTEKQPGVIKHLAYSKNNFGVRGGGGSRD